MTSLEAMWTIRFDAPLGESFELRGGVAVIESSRLFGGDSGYAYLGNVDVEGDAIRGSLRIIRHDPNIQSLFGDVDEFDLSFEGRRLSDDRIEGRLQVRGFPPGVFFMQRLAELP